MSSTGNITEGHRLFTEWNVFIANEEANRLHHHEECITMNVYGSNRRIQDPKDTPRSIAGSQ